MCIRMKLRLTRSLDDLPPQTSDEELLDWAAALCAETPPAPAPPPTSAAPNLVLGAESDRMSDEELFADIFERAAAVTGAQPG